MSYRWSLCWWILCIPIGVLRTEKIIIFPQFILFRSLSLSLSLCPKFPPTPEEIPSQRKEKLGKEKHNHSLRKESISCQLMGGVEVTPHSMPYSVNMYSAAQGLDVSRVPWAVNLHQSMVDSTYIYIYIYILILFVSK